MDETTNTVKKIRRTRKRVYETVEPENVPESGMEVAGVPIEDPAPPPFEAAVEAVEPPAEAVIEPVAERGTRALSVVKKYMLVAAGVGVIPIPVLDMATMLALQMLMVRKIAKIYDVPYAKARLKSAVAGLIGGFDAGYLGSFALRMVPLIGIFSYVAMPTLNTAITYGVGKVFIQHFESGGTFLDFDPKKVRAYFEEQFREGKLKALQGTRR